ncbi:MAG: CPBP family intramembrane glutamic endopeptidase [Pirellulales bacterium]
MNHAAERSNGFAMAVIVEGGLALSAVILAAVFHVSLREQIAPLGPEFGQAVLRGLAATVPMLAVFGWLATSRRTTLRKLREQVECMVREMFPDGSTLQFAMVALLAGVGEELLFRGAIQNAVAYWTTPIIALVVTSFLFGIAHALSRLYFFFAVAVGLFLGWLALAFNDLIAPMVAHGLYDFVALVYLSRVHSRNAQP